MVNDSTLAGRVKMSSRLAGECRRPAGRRSPERTCRGRSRRTCARRSSRRSASITSSFFDQDPSKKEQLHFIVQFGQIEGMSGATRRRMAMASFILSPISMRAASRRRNSANQATPIGTTDNSYHAAADDSAACEGAAASGRRHANRQYGDGLCSASRNDEAGDHQDPRRP